MKTEDRSQFVKILTMMSEIYDKTMTDEQIKLWFKLLEHVDIGVFEKAAMQYMRSDAAFMPKPGQILTRISEDDGRPNPEEAWGMITLDESETMVMTQEMLEGYCAAIPLQDDRVAARMAFKTTYEAAVKKARDAGISPVWSPSLGHDKRRRDSAIFKAVNDGKLLLDDVRHRYLAHLDDEAVGAQLSLPAKVSIHELEYDS